MEALKNLDHPNVIRLIGCYDDKDKYFLIMQYCRGGTLFNRIAQEENMSEMTAAKIFSQILRAIRFCHDNGMSHRDIKPENFMFESNDINSNLKLIDFGLAKKRVVSM